MKRYIKKALDSWGVQIVNRPDIFDDRNRCVTVVIDERINGDIMFLDALTLSTSSETLEDIVITLSNNVYDGFMKLFIEAINSYGRWMKVFMKEESGTEWWKAALERVEFVIEAYGLRLNNFTKLDYTRMVKTFGENGFRQLVIDAVCYDIDELPKCYFCRNCHTSHDGERECTRCYTPVEEGRGIKTLRMHADTPISNRIEDLLATFAHNEECAQFERRNTTLVDWAVRFRNAHF